MIECAVDVYNKIDNIRTCCAVCKEGYNDTAAVQDLCDEPITVWKKVRLFIWFILPSIAYNYLVEHLSEIIDPISRIGFEDTHLSEKFYPIWALVVITTVVSDPAKDLIHIVFGKWSFIE